MNQTELTALHRAVARKLNQVDFSTLWPGFAPCPFALYTDEAVCMGKARLQGETSFPWDSRFRGNTAIPYENGFAAIWDVERDFTGDGTENTALLAANLVHEMFHAYQYGAGESRFPEDIITLDYPFSGENFAAKWKENKLIAAAFQANTPAQGQETLARACALRRQRAGLIGADMILCESLSETAEGMAEYAGTLALGQLDPDSAQRRVEEYAAKLLNLSPLLFDIRRISYFSGALLLLAAHRAGIDFAHDISREKVPVFDLLAEKLPLMPEEPLPEPEEALLTGMEAAMALRRRETEDFLAQNPPKTEGDFAITGYDPMNMRKIDGWIYCAHFVALTEQRANATYTLAGPSVLVAEQGRPGRVKGYFYSGQEVIS